MRTVVQREKIVYLRLVYSCLEKQKIAQIARKLPSEANPTMENCDLGHSLFMHKGHIKFFCVSRADQKKILS